MRFGRERFFNEPHECSAARAINDIADAPPFASFTLYGDALHWPDRLDLYRNAKPAHDEGPVAVYDRAGPRMVKRSPAEAGPKESR